MRYLTLGELIELHRRIIEQSGGAEGIRGNTFLAFVFTRSTKRLLPRCPPLAGGSVTFVAYAGSEQE